MTPQDPAMQTHSRESDAQRPRKRRRKLQRRNSMRLNMAPMIDMTFLLFSFVIVTSTFDRPEGVLASQLPETTGAPTVALPLSPIVVRLNQTGTTASDFVIKIDRTDAVIDGLDRLATVLRQMRQQPGFDETTPVVIVADDDVRWDHVVACWNAALRAGCENIAFAQP